MILLDLGEICKEQDSSWRLEKKKEKEKKRKKRGKETPHGWAMGFPTSETTENSEMRCLDSMILFIQSSYFLND